MNNSVQKRIATYGSWVSPITSDLIASGLVRIVEVRLDRDDIYWLEVRPSEGGRYVVMRRSPDRVTSELTPAPFNARTRVHEYGGGSYLVANGTIYFSNFEDQRMYAQPPGQPPRPITPVAEMRYADAIIDRRRNRLICIREDHSGREQEPTNTIVGIDLRQTDEPFGRVLVKGNDFYSTARLSPDGNRLAWLTWNHPSMPWDGNELWVGEIEDDGSIGQAELVAGNERESIFQPEWSPDGVLHFVSDRTDWWNIYRWKDGKIEQVIEQGAEFGVPQWAFGLSTYAFESQDRIICTFTEGGVWRLASIDTVQKTLALIDTPYTDIRYLRAAPDRAVFCGASPSSDTCVVRLDLAKGQSRVFRSSSSLKIDDEYVSVPESIEFPTENGLTAHAFFYAPRNAAYAAPEGELPPLIVISHGGPTAASAGVLSAGIQFWTSRGFAVVDVNYGGSTGYGRAYRERLNGKWGIVDVDDCVNAARYLAERGLVDGNRLIIRGGSAGGYTTLAALTFRDVFKAGASHYGISDLEVLEEETHKFEAGYSSTLIAPYPERRDVFRERSPIHFTDRLSCPIILFQGLEDKVVPPNQAEMMFEAVRAKGIPVAYVPFAGEQHGFRKAENIKRALDAELYFYSKVFGFELSEPVEPVAIENL